jgi:hypothetical protein
MARPIQKYADSRRRHDKQLGTLFNRIRRSSIAVILALSTLGTVGVSQAFAAYYIGCFQTSNNYHGYVQRTNVLATSAFATVTYLRNVHQCNYFGGLEGDSFVLPVNVQMVGSSFVQLGWNQGHVATTNRFVFTPSDTSGGVMTGSAAFPTPTVGHSYTFTIARTTCLGAASWLYTVRDNTTATSYSACGSRVANQFSGAQLWSGYEVWDDGDQFGGAGIDINISNIGFNNGGADTYISSTTTYSTGTGHSYWVKSATLDADGHTVVHGRTTDH